MHEDPSAAAMMARHLDAYLVRTASSPAALAEAVSRLSPTAVIVDEVQRFATEQMLATLRGQAVPVISFPLPTLPQMAEKLKATDYLLKPVTREMLSQALARLPGGYSTILIADDFNGIGCGEALEEWGDIGHVSITRI